MMRIYLGLWLVATVFVMVGFWWDSPGDAKRKLHEKLWGQLAVVGGMILTCLATTVFGAVLWMALVYVFTGVVL